MNRKKAAPSVGAQTTEAPPAGAPITSYGEVSLDLIDPNPEQPRAAFDEAELKALAESIQENGLIQPIVIQALSTGRYILHDGERRLRASKLAGLERIPANIILSDARDAQQLLLRAIVANDQRADLSPIERARGYQKLADEHGLSDSDIARQVGKSRSVVANTRRLLNLPDDRQQQVAAGELNERQALALLPFYQLPQPIQKKVGATWQFRDVSAKPEKFNSDQIRDSLKGGLNQVTAEIKLFTPDEELGGPGVRHSKCTDCPFYLKVLSQEPRCTDGDCNQAKRHAWQRRELERAKAQTGLNFVDPSLNLPYGRYTDFYISTRPLLEQAIANKCPNLVLRCNRYASGGARPDGVSEHIELICLHPGKGSSCLCRKALEADKNAAEKAQKAENKQIKGQGIQVVVAALAGVPLVALKAVALHVAPYGERDKIAASTDPDWLSKKIAGILVNQSYYESAHPDTNRKNLTAWLAKIGLNLRDRSGAQVADLDRRLARIESWMADPPEETDPGQRIKAIRGNLTNLANLAEDMAQVEAPAELVSRYDAAKQTLLIWLDQEIEAAESQLRARHLGAGEPPVSEEETVEVELQEIVA